MGRIARCVVAAGLLWVAAAVGVGAQVEPSVAARDQQVVGNVVVVESVVAPEPGWVDIHAEAEVAGNPGSVIGYAPLLPGENNYVFVEVDSAKLTPVLYAVLHVDRGQAGVFEFPGADEPVKVDGKSVTAAFRVLQEQTRPSTEAPGVEVRDQALHDGEVVVGRVVASQAGFVDIHAEAELAGNPGPVIGYSPVAAGETTYVRVAVPADKVTPVLYAVLHIDEGEHGAFEFPGPDTPVQRDGQSVTAAFRLLRAVGQAPVASATVTAAPSTTPARTATPTLAPTATRTSAPTATRTTAPTATQTTALTATAAPTATATAAPTATLTTTSAPNATMAATPAQTAAPAAARSAAIGQSPIATPTQAGAAEQGPLPEALPRTGAAIAPALGGAAAILLLAGMALRRVGRSRS